MLFSRYYEIVVMKVSKTSLVRKPAHLFKNLTTYEGASYNQPYVTAILEWDYFETYEVIKFSLGMNIFLILCHSCLNGAGSFKIQKENDKQ